MAPATEIWDLLPIGLCIVDDTLEIIHINRAMKQILSSPENLSLPLRIDLLDAAVCSIANFG